jgi:aspartate 1-decarboxylase
MQITMLQSKIHRATVTDANLNYVGSITIDRELLEASGMRVGQKVDIVDINNGERFSTYIIPGERGKREICLNGAAARKVHVGDKIIIIAYALMEESEAERFQPKIVLLNDDNTIAQAFEGLE